MNTIAIILLVASVALIAPSQATISCYVCSSATSTYCGAVVDVTKAVSSTGNTTNSTTSSGVLIEAGCSYCETSKIDYTSTTTTDSYTRTCVTVGSAPSTGGCVSASGYETCVSYCTIDLCDVNGSAKAAASLAAIILAALVTRLL